ncbi:S-layer homology domain-containing protein [Paenibacillus agaridevorans]|uniref:S-layer homology domain-containing protein n=1 Tax=Paenibacillus agaridevorans TaxID=171404 RepID=UPI001BE43A9B|nr:S-layer homology domain-containing protein [Paenibacillus agaridevorans]
MKGMSKRLQIIAIAIMMMLSSFPSMAAASTDQPYQTYWVSPDGNDLNAGSESSPFKTIERARDVVRDQISGMTGDIVVYLKNGTYAIDDTLQFGPEDSGKGNYRVIYTAAPGAKPILSGGKKVEGWTLFDPSLGIYKATVPAGAEGARQFYVNGERATRAKSEDSPVDWQWSGSDGFLSEAHATADANEWVTIDLGEVRNDVSRVRLYPSSLKTVAGKAAGFPVDFTIEVSQDGVNFTVAKSVVGEATPDLQTEHVYDFDNQAARYVKINVTKLGESNRLEPGKHRLILSEVIVGSKGNEYTSDLNLVERTDFSTNVALNKLATVQGQLIPDIWPASYMTDGDPTTNITTVSNPDPAIERIASIELSSERAEPISAIRLWARMEGGVALNVPVDFAIEKSNDNANWTLITQVTDAQWTEPSLTVNFAPTEAKYIRLRTSKLGKGEEYEGVTIYMLQLADFAVYRTANLARNAPVDAPGSWEYPDLKFSKDKITDGILNGSQGQFTSHLDVTPNRADAKVTIDLGTPQEVGGVRLYPVYTPALKNLHYPEEMIIQTSLNGVDYQDALRLSQIPDSHGAAQEFILEQPVEGRYIRIIPQKTRNGELYEGNIYYGFQLVEAEVLPAATSTTLPAPAGIVSAAGAQLTGETYSFNQAVTSSSSTGNTSNGPNKLTDNILFNKADRSGFIVPASYNLQNWHNVDNLEVHILREWHHNIIRGERVSADGTNLVLDPVYWSRSPVANDRPTWIENAYELLDQAGEWYLDRQGTVDQSGVATLYYKPKAGQNISSLSAVLPAAEKLLVVQGTLDSPVQNLTFSVLTFEYAGWSGPNTHSYADAQAGTYVETHAVVFVPSAVEISYSHHIIVENNTFRNLGAGGLRLWQASQDNQVVGNAFHDISSGGIFVGSNDDHHAYVDDARDIVKNNTVSNNYITRTGVDYLDSVAIFVGFTENTVVAQNEIHAVPYSGISIGWGWGRQDPGGEEGYTTPTSAKNNRIENNLIYDVGKILHDGGLIYNLGAQPGTVISGNYVYGYHDDPNTHDVGIYLDSGSAYIDVKNNVVGGPVYWWNSIWASNIHDNHIHNNYYSVNRSRDYGFNNSVVDNTYVPGGDFASVPGAEAIISNAGLQSNYANIADDVPQRTVAIHQIQLEMYADSPALYLKKDSALLNLSILNEESSISIQPLDQTAKVFVSEDVDLTALTPVFTLKEGYSVTGYNGDSLDFSQGPITFTISNGSKSYVWTITVKRMNSAAGPITAPEVSLDDAIRATSYWSKPVTALTPPETGIAVSENSGYTGAKYGDVVLTFDMESNLTMDGPDWLGFTLRDQDPYTMFLDASTKSYAILVNHDTWELQKWTNGVREMLIGTIPGYTPRFGNVENVHYKPNQRHSIRTGAINVDQGVRIFLYVDGVKVFDVIDNDNPIMEDGFFSVYGMTQEITLYPYSNIKLPDTPDPGTTGNNGPVTPVVTPDPAKLTITNAADYLGKHVTNSDGQSNLTMEIGGSGASQATFTFPSELLALASAQGVNGVQVETAMAGLHLPLSALRSAIGDQAQEVTLIVSAADGSSLTEAQRQQMINGQIIHIQLEADGKPISSIDSSVRITLPINEADFEEIYVTVFQLLEDGTTVNLGGRYNSGQISFTAQTIGSYMVVSNKVEFQDVGRNYWAAKYISSMAAKGIILGMGDDRFSPASNITRGQMAALLARILDLKSTGQHQFADVSATSWYGEAVLALADAGIVQGSNGKFNPAAEISRQDLAVMLARALAYAGIKPSGQASAAYKDQDLIAGYAANAVEQLAGAGLMNGTGDQRFNPTAQATRAEVAKVVYLLYQML